MMLLTAVALVLTVAFGHADYTSERDINNKSILITGAAQGIGCAIADNFLKNGARLMLIVDKNTTQGEAAVKRLNEVYGDGKAVFICADVNTDLDKVDELVASQYGRPDVLVNNAGVIDEFNISSTIDTNLKSLMEWSLRMLEATSKKNGGKGSTIINISAYYGYAREPFLPIYKGAAYGSLGFSLTLGHQYSYRESGVRVITLCPSFTRTPMTDSVLASEKYDALFKKYTDSVIWQSADEVGQGTMEIFKNADSGTAYTIEGGKVFESPTSVHVPVDTIDSALA